MVREKDRRKPVSFRPAGEVKEQHHPEGGQGDGHNGQQQILGQIQHHGKAHQQQRTPEQEGDEIVIHPLRLLLDGLEAVHQSLRHPEEHIDDDAGRLIGRIAPIEHHHTAAQYGGAQAGQQPGGDVLGGGILSLIV